MRATGRRMGRIVGQLDDMVAQTEAYRMNETVHDDALCESIDRLSRLLCQAREQAEGIANAINNRDGRGK